MSIRPLHDRVVVKRKAEEKLSKGGIVIPGTGVEKPMQGEIIAVGNGKILKNGDVLPLEVKIGYWVLFDKYAGTEVTHAGEKLLLIKEEEIMAVIKE